MCSTSWRPDVVTRDALSAVARAISEAVAGYRIRTVPLTEVLTAAASVDRTAAATVGWRVTVGEAIDELIAAGAVDVPKTRFDRSAEPPLPAYLLRPARVRPQARPREDVVWHAELAWVAVADDAGRLSASDRRVLIRVNDWINRRRGVVVPMRERSLEIFGDEKQLERHLFGSLFGTERLTLDLLECEPCWPPVHQRIFGTGTWLVVENYTTFVSLTRRAETTTFDGRTIWGAGTQVGTRLSALALAGERTSSITYFGDIDAGGFRVARSAAHRCQDLGFGALEPASGLYQLALRHGIPCPDPTSRGASDIAAWTRSWLEGETGTQAATIVSSAQRIVQESVGTEVLAAHRLSDLLRESCRALGGRDE